MSPAQTMVLARPELRELQNGADELQNRRQEREALARHSQLPEHRVVFLKQVHGDGNIEVRATALPAREPYQGEGDALYTELTDTLLVIRTADCLPVLLEVSGAGRTVAAAIHGGWRGLKSEIVYKTLQRILTEKFSDHAPETVRAAFGPAISGPVYEVSADVAEHFSEVRPRPEHPGKYLLDLKASARNQLERALKANGLPADRLVFDPQHEGCTYSENTRFYSYRRGEKYGRILNTICIKAS